jgi:phosphotransferase system HPr-like phosphotransfer protein
LIRVAVEVEGWNAEAAIGFALAARKFASAVTLSRGRDTADGKDEVDVLTLGPELGDEVLLEVEGRDEKDAFRTLLARLLWVIEKPKSSMDAVLGLMQESRQGERAAPESRRAVRPFRGRVAEVAALDMVEEVALDAVEEVVSVPQFKLEQRLVSLALNGDKGALSVLRRALRSVRKQGHQPAYLALLDRQFTRLGPHVREQLRLALKELPAKTARDKAKRERARRIAAELAESFRAAREYIRSAQQDAQRQSRRPHPRKK